MFLSTSFMLGFILFPILSRQRVLDKMFFAEFWGPGHVSEGLDHQPTG